MKNHTCTRMHAGAHRIRLHKQVVTVKHLFPRSLNVPCRPRGRLCEKGKFVDSTTTANETPHMHVHACRCAGVCVCVCAKAHFMPCRPGCPPARPAGGRTQPVTGRSKPDWIGRAVRRPASSIRSGPSLWHGSNLLGGH